MASTENDRHYGGRSVAARKAERRSQLLDAALTVFTEKGYAATSVADLCAAAGLARRQFYDEFTGREELLLSLYDQIQLDARIAVIAAVTREPSDDIRDKAVAAMGAFAESIGSDPRRAHVSYIDIVGVSAQVEQRRIDQRAVWATFFETTIREFIGEDFVPPGGYQWAATAFIGALTALVHQWSTTDPRPPVTVLIEVMASLLNGLTAAAAAD